MDTSSEEWRAECEARWLATKKPHEIESFLEKVAKARGQEAADKLRSDARKEWRRRNERNKNDLRACG